MNISQARFQNDPSAFLARIQTAINQWRCVKTKFPHCILPAVHKTKNDSQLGDYFSNHRFIRLEFFQCFSNKEPTTRWKHPYSGTFCSVSLPNSPTAGRFHTRWINKLLDLN
jgi:hypothetical protein